MSATVLCVAARGKINTFYLCESAEARLGATQGSVSAPRSFH